MTDYFIYLDSYIFPITTKKNADKTDNSYECLLNMRTNLTSSMIHMPNITAQLNI